MATFHISMTAETTDGPHTVSTDVDYDFGEVLDNLAGVRAAIGEDNIISVTIERV